MSKISKYLLYEASVQNPKWQVNYLPQFHQWLTGRAPRSLREDFCGTGKISCEWVKKDPKHTAVALDIDPEALNYARNVNQAALPEKARDRVRFIKQNVLKPTKEKFDFIGVYNFSFYEFHERSMLLKYARSVRASLKSKGTFFMELGGGPGFTEPLAEIKKIRVGKQKFEEAWEQHMFDPISATCDFSIHFKLPGKAWMNDVFTYHWRIWTIREVREILIEAGFKKTVVLWETATTRGKGTGEFLPSEDAPPEHAWIAYVVGVK